VKVEAMGRLSNEDFEHFAVHGYLVVPDVVSEELLVAADAEVGEYIDRHEPHDGEGDATNPGQHGWFPPCRRLPRCDDVLRLSPALKIAQELCAPNELDHAFDHIQIATTMPEWEHVPGGPHIDGHRPELHPPASFTMLAGVFLTDQRKTQTGNLWVWPGSHLAHEALFHERGLTVLTDNSGHATLLDPPADFGAPVEVRGDRGDLLLAHFLLGHNKGGNMASHVRRTIYYRLAAAGHRERWEQTFLNAWTEYPRFEPRQSSPS
jgi:ectoine hydroxylase-related dioxygenase (phytanoyl-CoA dioxygenase family)